MALSVRQDIERKQLLIERKRKALDAQIAALLGSSWRPEELESRPEPSRKTS